MKNLVIENAKLMFRNFSGASRKYNPPGNRNFSVVLDPETATRLASDGWKIKTLAPRDEYTDPLFLLSVKVKYGDYPPKIVLITSRGKTVMDVNDIHILDFAILTNVDLMITPYRYEYNDLSGITAYLKSMYATIYEDELEQKYMDIPDSGVNSIMPNEA